VQASTSCHPPCQAPISRALQQLIPRRSPSPRPGRLLLVISACAYRYRLLLSRCFPACNKEPTDAAALQL